MKIGYFDTFTRVSPLRALPYSPSALVTRTASTAKIKTCERMWLTARIMAIIFQIDAAGFRLVCARSLTPRQCIRPAAMRPRPAPHSNRTLASERTIYKLFKFWWVHVFALTADRGRYFQCKRPDADLWSFGGVSRASFVARSIVCSSKFNWLFPMNGRGCHRTEKFDEQKREN